MTILVNPDFEKATETVEEYYRNVYIDNNAASINGFKGKKGKYGKGNPKGKGDYRFIPYGKRKENTHQKLDSKSYQTKSKGKGSDETMGNTDRYRSNDECGITRIFYAYSTQTVTTRRPTSTYTYTPVNGEGSISTG
eukprot:3270140-Amphidinium_carterae.2